MPLGDDQRRSDQRGRAGEEPAKERMVAVRTVQKGNEGGSVYVSLNLYRHKRSHRSTGWIAGSLTRLVRHSASIVAGRKAAARFVSPGGHIPPRACSTRRPP